MSNAWRSSRATFYNFLLLFILAGGARQLHAADTLQEIKTRGVLLWGADAEGGAPYAYPDPQKPEQLVGFEYDLADALAAKFGVRPGWSRTSGTNSFPPWNAAISTSSSTDSNSRRTTSAASRCPGRTSFMRSKSSREETRRD